MSAISGWGGRVQVNSSGTAIGTGTALSVTRWTLNDRSDALDVTTMEHGGLPGYISGIEEFDISFDCIYDSLLNPFLAAPNLNPGLSAGATPSASVYLALTLYMDRSTTTRAFFFPTVLVTDVQMDDEARGMVRYSVQAKYSRAVTFAAGATPTLGTVPTIPTANPG